MKDRSDNVSQEARISLREISNLHKNQRIKIVHYNKEFIKNKNLRLDVPDDLIVGSYLERQETEHKNIIFITNDNNSRTTARSVQLTPLELDWNKKRRLFTQNKYRPGYFNKILAIIFLALAFGLFNGALYQAKATTLVEHVRAIVLGEFSFKFVSNEKNRSKPKKDGPPLIDDNKYPYLVESEYGAQFQGKEMGDWGASAMVDSVADDKSRKFPASLNVVLGTWFTGSHKDKINELIYILEINGEEVESHPYFMFEYDEDEGIYLESVKSRVKFSPVTHIESLTFYISSIDSAEQVLDHAEKATIRLEHKVTGEVIGKIPSKIITPKN